MPRFFAAARRASSCQTLAGVPFRARPKSSGCSHRQIVWCGATSSVSTQRRTSVVPRSAFFLRSDFSQGKPNGNSLDLTGLGPSLFAQTALDHVEHGGDMMMISKSPLFILVTNSCHRSSSDMSCSSDICRSISVISSLTPLESHNFSRQLRTSLLRGAPENM